MTKFGVGGLGLASEPPEFLDRLPSALLWAKVWDTEGKWQCQGPWEISSSWTYILQNMCPLLTHQIYLIKILTVSQLWTCKDWTAVDSLLIDP